MCLILAVTALNKTDILDALVLLPEYQEKGVQGC